MGIKKGYDYRINERIRDVKEVRVISEDDDVIKSGVYKFVDALNIAKDNDLLFDPRKYLGAAREELVKLIISKDTNVLGCAGKA